MLLWLLVIIFAYFFFSLSYLGDKLILSGPPKAGAYTFYVGLMSLLAIFLIPFTSFSLPNLQILPWIIISGLSQIAGVYLMFIALEKFEVSKVMTTIGATQPIFIFGLTWIIFGPQAMSIGSLLAFGLLLLGSVLISSETKKGTLNGYLKLVLISSLMFSLDYVAQKKIFIELNFLQGLIWIRIFVFVFSLVLLFSKELRHEILTKRKFEGKKMSAIFITSQTAGALANILQSFAIALVPVAFLPIINSLRGIQYVFLFLMTFFLTAFFPKILKEEVSKKIFARKIISIILIMAGLYMLVF